MFALIPIVAILAIMLWPKPGTSLADMEREAAQWEAERDAQTEETKRWWE